MIARGRAWRRWRLPVVRCISHHRRGATIWGRGMLASRGCGMCSATRGRGHVVGLGLCEHHLACNVAGAAAAASTHLGPATPRVSRLCRGAWGAVTRGWTWTGKGAPSMQGYMHALVQGSPFPLLMRSAAPCIWVRIELNLGHFADSTPVQCKCERKGGLKRRGFDTRARRRSPQGSQRQR